MLHLLSYDGKNHASEFVVIRIMSFSGLANISTRYTISPVINR